MNPTCTNCLPAAISASTILLHASFSGANGFSTKTYFPASIPANTCFSCVASPVAITMASISSDFIRSAGFSYPFSYNFV